MTKLKVTCRLDDYSEPRMTPVMVSAHWNDNHLVVLATDGKEYTVSGRQLIKAIDNCMNT